MLNGSDYQRSIALMCREFLTDVEDMPEFFRENDMLDRITAAIIDEGDEDLFHIANLEAHIFRYSGKLLSMYSKNPEVLYLDKLYRRAESLREMCRNLLVRIDDDSSGPGNA